MNSFLLVGWMVIYFVSKDVLLCAPLMNLIKRTSVRTNSIANINSFSKNESAQGITTKAAGSCACETKYGKYLYLRIGKNI
jgi:hypothetical protein